MVMRQKISLFVGICLSDHVEVRPPQRKLISRNWYDREIQKGWIVIKSPSLTKNDILKILKMGRFYACRGPVKELKEAPEFKYINEVHKCNKRKNQSWFY